MTWLCGHIILVGFAQHACVCSFSICVIICDITSGCGLLILYFVLVTFVICSCLMSAVIFVVFVVCGL